MALPPASVCFVQNVSFFPLPQVANIKLGLPSTIIHVVKPTSPLYELSLEQMEAKGWEIFCFLDGMDPMTSNSLQARHSYR